MSYISIKNWSEDDQPREKLAKWGAEKLSASELLAILISTGSRGKSAIELAKDLLLLADNDINKLAKFTVEDIQEVKGLGLAKSVTIVAALELSRRRAMTNNEDRGITSVEDAIQILSPLLKDKTEEHFYVLLLSRSNKVLKKLEVGKGGISSVVVDPKVIMREAVLQRASGMILSHNHPSGTLSPSKQDIDLTDKIVSAAQMLDIQVIDHIIIAGDQYYSFKEEGRI